MGQFMQLNLRFEKSSGCPTNEALLAFLQALPNSSLAPEFQPLAKHLASCEFCELTLELLRAYPEEPPVLAPPSIPPAPESLFRLFTTKRETK